MFKKEEEWINRGEGHGQKQMYDQSSVSSQTNIDYIFINLFLVPDGT